MTAYIKGQMAGFRIWAALSSSTTITDTYGAVTNFTYDEAVRLTKTVDNKENAFSHTYDGNGNKKNSYY